MTQYVVAVRWLGVKTDPRIIGPCMSRQHAQQVLDELPEPDRNYATIVPLVLP